MRAIAAGLLTGTGTAAWTGPRFGFTSTLTDNGTGDYTINLDADFASVVAMTTGGFLPQATVVGATAGSATVEIVSATSLRVRVFDFSATPVALDAVVALVVWNVSSS